MMSRIFLTIILTLGLAIQGGFFCIQSDHDEVFAMVHTDQHIHVVNSDFDDDQRGVRKSYAAAFLAPPFASHAVAETPHVEILASFIASDRQLFKLKSVLLI